MFFLDFLLISQFPIAIFQAKRFEIESMVGSTNEHAVCTREKKKHCTRMVRFCMHQKHTHTDTQFVTCRRNDLRLWMVVIVIAHKYHFYAYSLLTILPLAPLFHSKREGKQMVWIPLKSTSSCSQLVLPLKKNRLIVPYL